MAALLCSSWKLCFRCPMTHNYGSKTMNTFLSLIIPRRLSFQTRMRGIIYLQSSRTMVLSSSGTDQDTSKRERRQQSVLLIDEAGNNLGETSLGIALNTAREKSLELVWTNKGNKTAMPVYKMMRKNDLKQKALKTPRTKNIEVTDKIEPRDLDFRLKQIQKWLEKGHQVRFCVKSKGKNEDDKWKIIKKVEQELEEIAVPVARPTEEIPQRIACIFKPHNNSNVV